MKKYIRWEEHKYLINIPIPYWDYFCSECGNRRVAIRWAGFIKYKTITHKRRKTYWDELNETTSKYLALEISDRTKRKNYLKVKWIK